MRRTAAATGFSRALPDRGRRWRSLALMVVYCWIGAIFPVIHAAAEQPAAVGTVTGDQQPTGSLPLGHDHLNCHFCATLSALVAAAPSISISVPDAPSVSAPTAAPQSPGLSWSRQAIPARAPPLS